MLRTLRSPTPAAVPSMRALRPSELFTGAGPVLSTSLVGTLSVGCCAGRGCLWLTSGWTTSRCCGVPTRWSTSDPSRHGHTSPGVSVMGDDLRAGPIRGQGEPSFGVQVCSQDRRSWVILCGELDLASAPHLQQVLDQLCRDGYSEIVLDLSGLEFLGAAGLSVFHRVDHQLRAANGRLILHRPGHRARRVLAITGLDTVLTIQPATARSLTGDPQRTRTPVLTNEGRPR